MTKDFKIFVGAFLVLIGAMLFLTACQAISAGEVYDKQFEPAHDEQYTAQRAETKWVYSWTDGNYHLVTVYVDYPATRRVEDRYVVFIEGRDKDDKRVTAEYAVDKRTYEQLKIGDWYDAEGGRK